VPISPEGFDRLRDLVSAGDPGPSDPADRRRVGKYRLIREVGRGGMAVVHEAEDLDLHRVVALKIVAAPDQHPHLIARLRREAKIIAQLRHPNIVAVHEVGTARDATGATVHYIAMEFVRGPTLAHVLAEAKTEGEALLRMLEDVARAVGHAHEQGVIHRDLKPGNILVDERGRGRLVDFGLAYGEDFRTKLTATQSVLGTPQYMAPEQVTGEAEQVGPPTDVYALGAILYEVLAGRLPYEGRSAAELYDRILHHPPVPLAEAAPSVDPRLALVCSKAMEKDPARRYADGEAFADDLARARFGQTVSARPPGVLRRVQDSLAGRRTAAAMLVGGLALLLLAAVVLPRLLVQERQSLQQLRKRTRTALDASLALRRAGSMEGMERFVAETEEACRETLRRFPDLAEPHYILGRMHRATMHEDEALAAQEQALELDPTFAPALYERIVLIASRYERRLEELHQWSWRETPPGEAMAAARRRAEADESALALLERLESDLARLRRLDAAPSAIGPGEMASAEGLLAWLTGDAAEARTHFQAALQEAPDLEEATFGLATVELLDGRHEASVAVWTRGVERDKGWVPFLEGRGFANLVWGFERSQRGEDAAARYDAAIADHRAAVGGGHARAETRLRLGIALVLAGFERSEGGQDPAISFAEALRAFEQAEGHVAAAQLRVWRGITHTAWGRSLAAHDQPAEEQFDLALADLNTALQADPDDASALLWRGVATANRALAGERSREDLPAVQQALADLDRAVQTDPEDPEARMWCGQLRLALALFEARAGKDAEPAFAQAMADLDEAIRLNPKNATRWARRGIARLAWAGALQKRRRDVPLALIEAAADDLRTAVRLNPSREEAWRGLARAAQVLAEMRENGGKKESTELWREGIQAAEKAGTLSPRHAKNLEVLGACRQGLGTDLSKRNAAGAAEELRKAVEAYEAAIKVDPQLETRLRPQIQRCRRAAGR